MRQGKITSFKLDYVKFVNNRAYVADNEATYYCMAGTYDTHDFVVSMVAAILTRKGTDCRVMHHGESVPDIIAGRVAIEVETKDKRGENFEKVRRRIEREKQDGYTVLVIVPSQDLRSKYQGIDGISILTPRELWQAELSDKEDNLIGR
jgi:predicted AAA+ superfamily ATPase